jgi:diaminopimelate epimerase
VDVHTRGGLLTIEWDGQGPVFMTGPAVTVFEGEMEVPESP